MNKKYKPSRKVGPEDLAKDDYITVTHRMYEFPTYDCAMSNQREIVIERYTMIAHDAGCVLKVVSVCLPFVLVSNTYGDRHTLDLRCHQIARLNNDFGRKAFKDLRRKQRKRKGK